MNQIDKLESQISEARSQSEDLALALENVRRPAQKYEPSFGAYDFLKSELARVADEAERKELLLKAESAIAHSTEQVAGLEAELAELRQRVANARAKVATAIARFNAARDQFASEILEFQRAVAVTCHDLEPARDLYSTSNFPIDGVELLEALPEAMQMNDGSARVRMADSGALRNERNFGGGMSFPKPWYKQF